MAELPDDLSLSRLRRELATRVVGSEILRYERVHSTNELLRSYARAGRSEGLVALAEEQTAGRGRLGRTWYAPPGGSILMSILLRPAWMAPSQAFMLTMLAGVALCEAVEQVTQVHAMLKWPNDLLLPVAPGAPELRKSAGILVDLEASGERVAWAVIGVGINVNWVPEGIVGGQDLRATATSLSMATGARVERLAVVRALLERLDAQYTGLRDARTRQGLFDTWRARLATLGQPVRVQLPDGDLSGVAEDVESNGALRVRDTQGAVHSVTSGDVDMF